MGRNDKKSKDQKARKYLDHGSVVLNTITRRFNVHNTIYCWRIFKYPKLQSYVVHFQEFDNNEVKCVLKFIKTDNTLYLCLRSNQLVNKVAQFYVMCETDHTFISVKAEEIRKGLYIGEFNNELFDGPELQYLQNGVLLISFRYVSDEVSQDHEIEFDGVDILADLDELCCDLKHMYLESMYPDFEIKAKDYVFDAHKFILSARCKFFEKMFEMDPEIRQMEATADTIPGILHEVLLYVYCGELRDMDLSCMIEVLDLAYYFDIYSLVKKCTDYFDSRLNASNFDEFQAIVEGKPSSDLRLFLERIKAAIYS